MQTPNIGKFPLYLFLAIALFGLGVYVGGVSRLGDFFVPSSNQAISYDQSYINSIINKIEQNYLGELPSSEQVTREMVRGIVESLGDGFSSYLDPSEARQYYQDVDSTYEGIGVYLDFNGEYTTVLSPIDGYPGQLAGLLPGDWILEVDGQDVAGQRPEITAKMILGKSGTEVRLSIYRESDARIYDFTIRRQQINLENISYRLLEEDIVLIDINRFIEVDNGSRSGAQVFNDNWNALVSRVSSLRPKGLVIDLRNNPGGYVTSVRHVLEEFMQEGDVIMQEEEKSMARKLYRSTRQGAFSNLPVVVLVNAGSASAAEIFAGAIQDNNTGLVLGQSTYGKGVEQIVLEIEDGSLLFIVYKRWLTSAGRQLSTENPIQPDSIVDFTPSGAGSKYDSQITAALELLVSGAQVR